MDNAQYKNLWISTLIIVACGGVAMYISTNSKSDLGDGFALFSWFFVTIPFGLIGAVLFFILRAIRLIKRQTNFFYCFFAVLNFCLGVVGLGLSFFVQLNRTAFFIFLLNLLVGILLLADIFLFRTIFKRS